MDNQPPTQGTSTVQSNGAVLPVQNGPSFAAPNVAPSVASSQNQPNIAPAVRQMAPAPTGFAPTPGSRFVPVQRNPRNNVRIAPAQVPRFASTPGSRFVPVCKVPFSAPAAPNLAQDVPQIDRAQNAPCSSAQVSSTLAPVQLAPTQPAAAQLAPTYPAAAQLNSNIAPTNPPPWNLHHVLAPANAMQSRPQILDASILNHGNPSFGYMPSQNLPTVGASAQNFPSSSSAVLPNNLLNGAPINSGNGQMVQTLHPAVVQAALHAAATLQLNFVRNAPPPFLGYPSFPQYGYGASGGYDDDIQIINVLPAQAPPPPPQQQRLYGLPGSAPLANVATPSSPAIVPDLVPRVQIKIEVEEEPDQIIFNTTQCSLGANCIKDSYQYMPRYGLKVMKCQQPGCDNWFHSYCLTLRNYNLKRHFVCCNNTPPAHLEAARDGVVRRRMMDKRQDKTNKRNQ